MHTRIEEILEDIYTLDPSLKESGDSLRTIVTALIESRPTISVDSDFVLRLRKNLVLPQQHTVTFSTHSWNWWMFRLAPVGAIALLILMLVPNLDMQTEYEMNTLPTESTVQAPTAEDSTQIADSAPQMPEAPNAKRAGIAPPNVSLMQVVNTSEEQDRFTASEQAPGNVVYVDFVSLTVPSFVVVSQQNTGDGSREEIIGVSPLLSVGATAQLAVPLAQSTTAGETLILHMYHDDGDGLFVEQNDVLVLNPETQQPLEQSLNVSADVQ